MRSRNLVFEETRLRPPVPPVARKQHMTCPAHDITSRAHAAYGQSSNRHGFAMRASPGVTTLAKKEISLFSTRTPHARTADAHPAPGFDLRNASPAARL